MKYWPKEPGEYAVHIMCDDEDIKDSPYMAFIRPASGDFNPDKVIYTAHWGITWFGRTLTEVLLKASGNTLDSEAASI